MSGKTKFAQQYGVSQVTASDVENLMSNITEGESDRNDYVMIMDYNGRIDILAQVIFRNYGGFEICRLSEVLSGSLGEIPKDDEDYGYAAEYLNEWLENDAPDFWEWLENPGKNGDVDSSYDEDDDDEEEDGEE